MRKANKIMMITVSVLLCLVLFTSTALSGTLAKYSTSGQTGTASARVAKWGVGIDIIVDEDGKLATICPDSISRVVINHPGNSVTAELSGLKIAPGDDLSNIVKIVFSGQPEVKLRATLTVRFVYKGESYSHIKLDDGVGGEVLTSSSATYVMPVGFKFGASNSSNSNNVLESSYVADPWRYKVYTGTSNPSKTPIGMNRTEDAIVGGIESKIDVTAMKTKTTVTENTNVNDAYIFKEFAPNSNVLFYENSDATAKTKPFDTFELGFVWPFEDSTYSSSRFTVEEKNEIDTWFAKNKTASTFTITYTIAVEQVQ